LIVRTLLSIAAVAVCFGVLGCDPTAVIEENGQDVGGNVDPVTSQNASDARPRRDEQAKNVAALQKTADRWLESLREWLNQKDVVTQFGSMQNPDLMKQAIPAANYKWRTAYLNGGDPMVEIVEILYKQTSVEGKADWTVSLASTSPDEVNFDVTYRLKEIKSMWPGPKQLKLLTTIRDKLIGESDTIRLKIPVEYLDGEWRVAESEAKIGWGAAFARKEGNDLVMPTLNARLVGLANTDLSRVGGADVDEMRKFNLWCASKIRSEIKMPTDKFLNRPDVIQATFGNR
jgi:hypothetical protein